MIKVIEVYVFHISVLHLAVLLIWFWWLLLAYWF